MEKDRFSSYTFGEGRTGIGQMVEFSHPLDVTAQQVAEFLQKNVRSIDVPTTGRVLVPHGGFGKYTRYEVVQHKYAGGGGGFIEVLEIKNPPDSRWGIVIYEYTIYNESVFTEWDTMENALAAFEKCWGSDDRGEKFPKLPGFKRRVVCGALTPWFYAIGDEQLIGDYTFPEGLQDDAVFRFGRQFVVFDREGVPAVKTCMGTRFVEWKSDLHSHDDQRYRLVYWDDGSVWNEGDNGIGGSPRPLEDGEMWIAEAIQQFKKLLTGQSEEFTINFTNGHKFVGRLVRSKCRVPCAEGDYFIVARLKNEKKPVEGWVRDFKPTPETPNIVQCVIQHYARKGQEVEHLEIKECKAMRGGKKWSGVFFQPSA